MSAAATAAGYLYASGRLRGRAAREQEQSEGHARPEPHREKKPARRETRVAVLPERGEPPRTEQPRKTPKIEYRRRRWAPE
jgi:hypothetical protein